MRSHKVAGLEPSFWWLWRRPTFTLEFCSDEWCITCKTKISVFPSNIFLKCQGFTFIFIQKVMPMLEIMCLVNMANESLKFVFIQRWLESPSCFWFWSVNLFWNATYFVELIWNEMQDCWWMGLCLRFHMDFGHYALVWWYCFPLLCFCVPTQKSVLSGWIIAHFFYFNCFSSYIGFIATAVVVLMAIVLSMLFFTSSSYESEKDKDGFDHKFLDISHFSIAFNVFTFAFGATAVVIFFFDSFTLWLNFDLQKIPS